LVEKVVIKLYIGDMDHKKYSRGVGGGRQASEVGSKAPGLPLAPTLAALNDDAATQLTD